MSLATVDIVQMLAGDPTPPTAKSAQAMLFLAGAFTFVLWICTMKLNRTLNLLFFLLTVTFFLLTGGVRNETVDKIGGWFGFVTAAVAYWLAAAELINDIHGEGKREIIPLGTYSRESALHGAFQAPGRIQPAPHRNIFASTRNLLSHRSSPTTTNSVEAMSTPPIPEVSDLENGVTKENV